MPRLGSMKRTALQTSSSRGLRLKSSCCSCETAVRPLLLLLTSCKLLALRLSRWSPGNWRTSATSSIAAKLLPAKLRSRSWGSCWWSKLLLPPTTTSVSRLSDRSRLSRLASRRSTASNWTIARPLSVMRRCLRPTSWGISDKRPSQLLFSAAASSGQPDRVRSTMSALRGGSGRLCSILTVVLSTEAASSQVLPSQ